MLAQGSALLAGARDIISQYQVAPTNLCRARLPERETQVRQTTVEARPVRDNSRAELGRDDKADFSNLKSRAKLAPHARQNGEATYPDQQSHARL